MNESFIHEICGVEVVIWRADKQLLQLVQLERERIADMGAAVGHWSVGPVAYLMLDDMRRCRPQMYHEAGLSDGVPVLLASRAKPLAVTAVADAEHALRRALISVGLSKLNVLSGQLADATHYCDACGPVTIDNDSCINCERPVCWTREAEVGRPVGGWFINSLDSEGD